MTLDLLKDLEVTLREEVPAFRIEFKDESLFMRVLGQVTRPFNARFMTSFTTTIGSTVYFPSREFYEDDPQHRIVTLAHEFVHIWDSREAGPRFQLSYAAPQVYALGPLVAYGVWGSGWSLAAFFASYLLLSPLAKLSPILFWIAFGLALVGVSLMAVIWSGWWCLALLMGLACLAPWGSPGRTRWELRGYSMNVALRVWMGSSLTNEALEHYVRQFTGPNYWYMCRDRNKVEASLRLASTRAQQGTLQESGPYSIIHAFLRKHGVVRD